MRSAERVLVLVILLAVTPTAVAQVCLSTATVSPPSPTEDDAVTLAFTAYVEDSSCTSLAYEVEGNIIIVRTLWDCVVMPRFEQRQLPIGRLPAGTYQVFVFDHREPDTALACGSFTVAAAPDPIPTLSLPLLAALALAVAAAGALAMRMR
jgi:hypothetical protein